MPSIPLPISEIANKIHLSPGEIIPYGTYKAKVNMARTDEKKIREAKLILVTSITPTRAGNGKTTCSIGLADGLTRIGEKAILALREPSLGPCFGMKGGATGGGLSQLVPADDINLHFTGDFHAISAANNMLAALLDNYNFHRQGTRDEMKEIFWRRVMDVNDRSLRYIITGLHGGKNGLPTETGFDITPASELMAILCLSQSRQELRDRIDKIVLGFTADNRALTPKDLQISGAIAALMKDAYLPNLVQTLEGTPVLMHGGPFANIAHGCNSILATKAAMQLGDYVLTEAGFGSDLGAEKFFNIKCRTAGISPALSVIIITTRSLKLHGGIAYDNIAQPDEQGLLAGMRNLKKHLGILAGFGQKTLVVLNRYAGDSATETDLIRNWCSNEGVPFAVSDGFNLGSEGTTEAASLIVELTRSGPPPLQYTYDLNQSIEDKVMLIARKIYGARGVFYEKKARAMLKRIHALGCDHFPVCIAKTQYSFTDNPEAIHQLEDFELTVDDIVINAGARFIVVVCGEMMRMPGLPEFPSATAIDLADGKIIGLG